MAEDICPDGSSWTSPAGALCVRGTRITAASVAAAHASITATAASLIFDASPGSATLVMDQ
jgi:hypothetical protein